MPSITVFFCSPGFTVSFHTHKLSLSPSLCAFSSSPSLVFLHFSDTVSLFSNYSNHWRLPLLVVTLIRRHRNSLKKGATTAYNISSSGETKHKTPHRTVLSREITLFTASIFRKHYPPHCIMHQCHSLPVYQTRHTNNRGSRLFKPVEPSARS